MAFVRVASTGDLAPGGVKVVEVGEEEIALCNVEGQIYAAANVCTHDNGPLGAGHLIGSEIECPRHGARFDVRTGEAKTLPAVVPLPTFDVKVEGDDILVDVERVEC